MKLIVNYLIETLISVLVFIETNVEYSVNRVKHLLKTK